MMKKIPNIYLSLDEGLAVEKSLEPDLSSSELASILGIPHAWLLKRSVDARHKDDVHFVATVGVPEGYEPQSATGVSDGPEPQAVIPLADRSLPGQRAVEHRPVVVGMGPAGLFAALELAEAGLCPLVIERGAPVAERTEDVIRFERTGVLDTQSNVQFGEGGAGTFSDGKLNTGTHSPYIAQVLKTFAAAGANPDVLWQAKPHIGTDVLCDVVHEIRQRIIACGGEVRFHTQLVGFTTCPAADGGRKITGVVVQGQSDESEIVPAEHVILACGHSARDTFSLLKKEGLELVPKPFALGVRIEHPQWLIDKGQYGQAAGHPALGAADYKLVSHLKNGRSAYSFCMCPGGTVVAAASEDEQICVNGMSVQARDGENANSALLVNVTPEDFAAAAKEFGTPDDELAGIAFQRRWEHAAYVLGGDDWTAPAETLGDFLGTSSQKGRGRNKGRRGPKPVSVEPTYPLGVREADVSFCLPPFVTEALREAIPQMDRRLHGFSNPGAVITGVEARSSSPVRIVRDKESYQATRMAGLYPAGEGAGYAGGITSSAVDGIRVARAVMKELG